MWFFSPKNPYLIQMNPRSEWFKRNPKNSDLGFIRIERLVRIHVDSKSRIDSGWDGLIFNRITSNEIKNFFRIDSDEFGLARKQISE